MLWVAQSDPSRRVKPSNCRCPFHRQLAPNILSRSECQCISGHYFKKGRGSERGRETRLLSEQSWPPSAGTLPPAPESSVRERLHPLRPFSTLLSFPGSQDLAFQNGKVPIPSKSPLRGACIPPGLPTPRPLGQAPHQPPAPGYTRSQGVEGASRLPGSHRSAAALGGSAPAAVQPCGLREPPGFYFQQPTRPRQVAIARSCGRLTRGRTIQQRRCTRRGQTTAQAITPKRAEERELSRSRLHRAPREAALLWGATDRPEGILREQSYWLGGSKGEASGMLVTL